jgi:hypothetical protein
MKILNTDNRFLIAVCFVLVIGGCQTTPPIQIPESIETDLRHRFDEYKRNVEGACKKDSNALIYVLKVNNIEDGATYDHGVVLIKIYMLIGESSFIKGINGLTPSEKMNLRMYVEAGLDRYNSDFLKEFTPKNKRLFEALNMNWQHYTN